MRRFGGVACGLAAAAALLPASAVAEHSVIERVSRGAPPGSSYGMCCTAKASPDGSRLLYRTNGRLVPQDTDSAIDLYRWTNGVNELLSIGPAGGNGPVGIDQFQAGSSTDLSHAFFVTSEALVPEDSDGERDLYERAGSVTRLVTSGSVPGDAGSFSLPTVNYVTPDGSHVFFTTQEQAVPEDTDSIADAYVRSGGVTRLVTARPDGDNANGFFGGATTDGSRAWFVSTDALVPADTDAAADVYERSGGTTTLVSAAPGSTASLFSGASADGSRIFIATYDQLTPDDPDTDRDTYEMTPSGPVLITTGPADDATGANDEDLVQVTVSADGSRVWWNTTEKLFAGVPFGDYLYERSGGTTKLISGPPVDGEGNQCWFDVSPPNICSSLAKAAGDTVFHRTTARLVPEDTDTASDIYAWSSGVNRLVSIGTNSGEGAQFVGATDDGRVFFNTTAQLLPADTDAHGDIYEDHGGMLSIVTYGPSAGSVSGAGFVTAVSGDGDVFFSSPELFGDATGTASNMYVARIADRTGYPRPRSASPQRVALVPAYRSCEIPNRVHGPPLGFASCAPPVQTSGLLTVGTPDANGQPAKARGHVLLETLVGDPATSADEADIHLEAFDEDIRRASDLSDYLGELQVALGLRITERDGPTPAGGGPAPVTQQDVALSFTVPCIPTADPRVGATCSAATTADALAPGVVVERRRAIWELRHVRVLDGGPDGDAETGTGNGLFQVPGVFIP